MDWRQLGEIVSQPDNIPIVGLALLVPFFAWYAWRQARATDSLIAELEADPALAATHHRKPEPDDPSWPRELPVWPYLLRIEFLAALIVTVLILVWAIAINAPLEEPANPNFSMNPAKAPWYFVGLQEMLVYFDPWFAGVALPVLIIAGLLAFPYIDANPLGVGYYSLRQRAIALWGFGTGFALWLLLIFIGTFVRGPGWMWFWPGQTWDHTRVTYEVNRNLAGAFGIANPWLGALVGLLALVAFYYAASKAIQKLVTRTPLDRQIYARTSRLQFFIFRFFAITVLCGLPVKMLLRLVFRIQYVLVTPWFNL